MHVHDWEPTHCPHCGGKLINKRIRDNEPERLFCSACGSVYYRDPKLAACALVAIDGKVLLCRRGIEPAKGMWVIPGGFVDRGEVVKEAVQREVLEETGLTVAAGRLFGLYSYPGETVVVAVYLARVLGGKLSALDETSEVRLFDPGRIPWDRLAFQSTKDCLTDYVQGPADARC